jgi:UDP-N-acetylmuramoyl-L-alanyl-D-glutamate--2,6-diaminopimelate ligase
MRRKIIAVYKQMGHIGYAVFATLRYARWYRRLTIVGVTGTDGKSSTVLLAAQYLRTLGVTTAHYSSISIHDGEHEITNAFKMTMPGKGRLHQFLATAAKNGATHAVIEVTSEGIRQWRHFGIHFDVVAFTNITPEHIERHGSFEQYAAAKLSLVWSLRPGGVVVFSEDDQVVAPALSTKQGMVRVAVSPVSIPLQYDYFLRMNASFARTIVEHCPGVTIKKGTALSDLPLPVIPGRMEVFRSEEKTVVVDYAHTIYAVELCLKIARAETKGRIIHVFGAAGGGRDSYKRPLLAKLSERYADVHIVTEENSFDEPVAHIMSAIVSGFITEHPVYQIPVREDAVKFALSLAGPQDTVLCTAKGSETVIAGPNRTLRPYHERAFVTLCLGIK